MTNDDIKYFSVLLEEIKRQNQAVLKVVGGMKRELKRVPKREEFEELQQDVKIIRAAMTNLSHQVHDHEHRITKTRSCVNCSCYAAFASTNWVGMHIILSRCLKACSPQIVFLVSPSIASLLL